MIGAIVYPHQLFDRHPVFQKAERLWLVETPRFFTGAAFHKKKLLFHRASMKHWAKQASKHVPVDYVNIIPELPRCTDEQAAYTKLERYWHILGFERIWDTRYICALCTNNKYPSIQERYPDC